MNRTELDHPTVVADFNRAINARELAALTALMTPDHRFIDSAGSVVSGVRSVTRVWQGFFAGFPDYMNIFSSVVEQPDGGVVVEGRSECSNPQLAGPALWRARVRDGKVAEWQVYDDTADNRSRLGLSHHGMDSP
jgi:ketosteroid isomerase-like protein